MTARTWSNGPITANDIYDGESYDARLEQKGSGTSPRFFDARLAARFVRVSAPSHSGSSQTRPPADPGGGDTLRPVRIAEPGSPGSTYSTSARTSPAGRGCTSRARARYGRYSFTSPRRISTMTGRWTHIPTGLLRPPTHTCSQGPGRPRRTSRGSPTTVSVMWRCAALRSRRRWTRSRVASSTPMLTQTGPASPPRTALINQIYANNRWTMLNNSMSFPTDNPVRDERTPPGMDVQAYQDASTRDFDMGRFYANLPRRCHARPGTALPNDSGNAQNPDMGGDQMLAGLDALPAVRRPGHPGPDVPGHEGLRRRQRG